MENWGLETGPCNIADKSAAVLALHKGQGE